MPIDDVATIDLVRAAALPLAEHDAHAAHAAHAALRGWIGDARFVLLGEASHGSHEFYDERARITQRLIEAHGFRAVAVEGDWPDAYRVNRFVRDQRDLNGVRRCDTSAREALGGFRRFPGWMWRNTDVLGFVDWLRTFNDAQPRDRRCGFYGLDMYSLHASMQRVLAYLERHRPEAVQEARERYGCFDRFGSDSQTYGMLTGLRGAEGCEDEVVAMLSQFGDHSAPRNGAVGTDAEAAFEARQNALLVKNAEGYYRAMYTRGVSSWNLRDSHMAQTLDAIAAHLGSDGQVPKVVVWAHNSHVGDARATEMGDARATEMGAVRGELTLGQLVRQRHADAAFLVGFTTHAGTVTAASDWDAPAQRKTIVPSLAGSIERLMHDTGMPRLALHLRGHGAHAAALRERRLERAIGVIYRPETERQSHYFEAALSRQFDALVHIDTTHALEPLDRDAGVQSTDAPETYPSGT
jgi:erythromycin esterase-like protein